MSGPSSQAPSPLVQALGRIPSGLFILTVRHDGRATGLLASWVQQAGFAPPMLTVAVASQRHVADWIAASRQFTLNQVAAGNKALLKHFGRGFPPDAEAFEGIELVEAGPGPPVIASALSYLEAEATDEFASGDHRIFLARINGGAVLHPEGHPMVHIRSSGHHY